MKAHYYKHTWVQEPEQRGWECYECGERSVYHAPIAGFITLWTATDANKCLRVIDYKEEQE